MINSKFWRYVFVLLLVTLSLGIICLIETPDKNFHIIACNVGQGDAILITYKNIQILTDGGPDKKVLDCLGRHVPFYDREIEMVVLTHPELDHFGGLTEVVKRYKVKNYLYNQIAVSNPEYQVLEKMVGRGGITRLNPAYTQRMRLGLIQLDILEPSVQLKINNEEPMSGSNVQTGELNHYSIVSLISFGNFKALLTGDMPPEISDYLASTSVLSEVEWIKIPHHGSTNGLTQNLLELLRPDVAVISVGKNNYGQPSPEILKMLNDHNVKYFRTDEVGDVEIISDGKSFWKK